MRGASCFMGSVWRDLPSDILVKVMTILPIASLCRFRTVSKAWNRLISDPDSGFPASHARASSPEEYVLITLRYNYSFHPPYGWEVLDVANKRYFTLSDDFINEYVLKKYPPEDPEDPVDVSDERATLAADGGLVCVAYFWWPENCIMLLVCNPVLRTAKELPGLDNDAEVSFRGFLTEQPTVVMRTDRRSMEFEIFVINHADHPNHPNALHIYESKTGKWRTASVAAPQRLSCRFDERNCCPVSTFIKNKLYKVIYKPSDSSDNAIVSFDKATGVVTDLDFHDLPNDGDERQLVVSNDRLFYVVFSDVKPPSIEIFELILARKECIRFTEMPSDVVDWISDGFALSNTVASNGCANSILIHSSGGRSAACNLSNKSWERFPQGRDHDEHDQFHNHMDFEQGFYASSNCLSLFPP